ncbi:glycosyltransferase family 4 protein [Tautonia rosea]|uniref:glycosyltransferase family 4 protein n=1 Tax=Tautonia rosea TaxID=2728037 RepID=UPI00147549ED|nr:glycosyltransferase family 4 protein [Tautonia rosea]
MTQLAPPPRRAGEGSATDRAPSVLVACPDARPPAYQAVVGLGDRGQLDAFLTGFYYRGNESWSRLGATIAPGGFARIERSLKRRHLEAIPGDRVRSTLAFDASLALERRLAGRWANARGTMARWRTDRFDRTLASRIRLTLPGTALIFSDVGSEHALPECRRQGVFAVLSMVHGDVREERRILSEEAERSAEVFHLYLGDEPIDRGELDWLHERRLRDLELADRILVPSDHIAGELRKHGTPGDRIRVIPYAADTKRFRPQDGKRYGSSCTFLFAGGISQRKGISYLLRAWQQVRRPGWRLQLLGAAPRDLGPLAGLMEGVELLGRVPHSEVPGVMASADVFVFPSLFEGSAVVTYEALACGLPSVVTPSSGSVARDGVDGIVVPPADVESLARGMERLGTDPELRASCAASARSRAEAFDWTRYHRSVADAVAVGAMEQG